MLSSSSRARRGEARRGERARARARPAGRAACRPCTRRDRTCAAACEAGEKERRRTRKTGERRSNRKEKRRRRGAPRAPRITAPHPPAMAQSFARVLRESEDENPTELSPYFNPRPRVVGKDPSASIPGRRARPAQRAVAGGTVKSRAISLERFALTKFVHNDVFRRSYFSPAGSPLHRSVE